MISGPYAGGVARNWGESHYHSQGHFQHGMARSGSISASFDEEGNAVSASGSLLVAETFGGQATSHITAWGKSVLGSQSGTGGMVVATRDFTQDRTGEFQGSRISTVTPLLGSDGSLSFETLEGELTGTRSGSQTTSDIRSVYELHNGTVATHGNLFAVTDSGEAPAGGGGASQVYLLPPTQMANDPQPEVDVSLSSSGGLGYFSSAFGFRGGIVGASFATALPGDPSLPNSTTFGDQILASDGWLQEPGQQEANADDDLRRVAVPPHRVRKVAELLDTGMPALKSFVQANPEVFEKFIETYGEKGLERLVTVLSWGYWVEFRNFSSVYTWGLPTTQGPVTLTIDSNTSWLRWGDDSIDRQAYLLDYALKSAIDGQYVSAPKNMEDVGILSLGDMETWNGVSTYQGFRDSNHKILSFGNEVSENVFEEVLSNYGGRKTLQLVVAGGTIGAMVWLGRNAPVSGRWIGSKLSAEATQEAADSMVRRISSLKMGNMDAINEVRQVGSRATGWSKLKNRGPLADSDLDIAIDDWVGLKGSRHDTRVVKRIQDLAKEFEDATGLRVQLHLRSQYGPQEWGEYFGEYFK